MLVSISLFIKGLDLNPALISAALNVTPTKSQMRGEIWVSPSGKIYSRDTGLWIWCTKEDSDSASVLEGVDQLWRQFNPAVNTFSKLPGVELSWVDVFVCHEPTEGESSEVAFSLPQEALRKLTDLGLPVEFTIGIVESSS